MSSEKWHEEDIRDVPSIHFELKSNPEIASPPTLVCRKKRGGNASNSLSMHFLFIIRNIKILMHKSENDIEHFVMFRANTPQGAHFNVYVTYDCNFRPISVLKGLLSGKWWIQDVCGWIQWFIGEIDWLILVCWVYLRLQAGPTEIVDLVVDFELFAGVALHWSSKRRTADSTYLWLNEIETIFHLSCDGVVTLFCIDEFPKTPFGNSALSPYRVIYSFPSA